jgi:signal transduction histidine kinase
MEQWAEWESSGNRRGELPADLRAAPRIPGETVAEVAHDARNMVTALALYCDLLMEPGVLAEPFRHYGSELRLVAAASRRLVEKLELLDVESGPGSAMPHSTPPDPGKKPVQPAREMRPRPGYPWDSICALPIDNLAAELSANRTLLAALAGPAVALTVDVEGGARPVRLNGEDLTRVLVNLIKNAAEAMPAGGRVSLRLRGLHASAAGAEMLSLIIEDSGPGIPPSALETIFEPGFSARPRSATDGSWPSAHRGLGLSISRSILEAAGGTITASNRLPKGACFTIDLPVRGG